MHASTCHNWEKLDRKIGPYARAHLGFRHSLALNVAQLGRKPNEITPGSPLYEGKAFHATTQYTSTVYQSKFEHFLINTIKVSAKKITEIDVTVLSDWEDEHIHARGTVQGTNPLVAKLRSSLQLLQPVTLHQCALVFVSIQ